MADEVETGFFLGTGGNIHLMALPLPENIEHQVTRGELRRVNEDGTPYDTHSATDLSSGETKRPGQNASKNEWVGFAVSQGMTVDDADAATKAELIEKYGK